MFAYDVDCASLDESNRIAQKMLEMKTEIGLLEMSRSARYGLHLVLRREMGKTILENQVRVSMLTKTEMDTQAHDLGRVMFTTTADADELLYLDDAIFTETMTIEESEQEYKTLKEREKKNQEEVPAGAKKANKHYRPWEDNGTTSVTKPEMEVTINDVPAKPDMRYLKVFNEFMDDAGLSERSLQIEGVRHNSLLSIFSVGACRLIPKAQMIAIVRHLTPEYAKEDDCQKLIDDFYKATDPNAALTKRQREILAEAFNEQDGDVEDEEVEQESADKKRYKLIAKLLPSGLREPVMAAPKDVQMNVICSIMPIAAAYADQVEVKYADDKMQHLGLMSMIIARQAGGKSGCKEAVECWIKIIKDESKALRVKEDEVKRRNKCRKANERAEEVPQSPIRKVPITISTSTLLKRFKAVPGRCIVSFSEELDTLLNVK
jgi:hypothetical protein